jgi:hypothetical protein
MAKVGRYKFLELMLAHVLIQEAAVHIASWKKNKNNPVNNFVIMSVHFLFNGAQIMFNWFTL